MRDKALKATRALEATKAPEATSENKTLVTNHQKKRKENTHAGTELLQEHEHRLEVQESP